MSERHNQITFQVTSQPAAFSRSAAAASSRMKSVNGKRRGVLPENIKVWRDAIRAAYWTAIRSDPRYEHFPAGGEYTGPVGFVIEVYGSKADLLNIGKEVEDALNEVAFHDDRQVVDCRVLAPMRAFTPGGGVKGPIDGEVPGARVTLMLYDL